MHEGINPTIRDIKGKATEAAIGIPLKAVIGPALPRSERKFVQPNNFEYDPQYCLDIRRAAEADSAFIVVSTHAGHAGYLHLEYQAEQTRIQVNAVRALRDLPADQERDRRRIEEKYLIATNTIVDKQGHFLHALMPIVGDELRKKHTEILYVTRREDPGSSEKNRQPMRRVITGIKNGSAMLEVFSEGNLEHGRPVSSESTERWGMQPPSCEGLLFLATQVSLKEKRPMTIVLMGLNGEDNIISPVSRWPKRQAVNAVFNPLGGRDVPVTARVGLIDAKSIIDEITAEKGTCDADDFEWRLQYKLAQYVDKNDRGICRLPEPITREITAQVMSEVKETTRRFSNKRFYEIAHARGYSIAA